jgi:hypothetical protein
MQFLTSSLLETSVEQNKLQQGKKRGGTEEGAACTFSVECPDFSSCRMTVNVQSCLFDHMHDLRVPARAILSLSEDYMRQLPVELEKDDQGP